MQSHANSPIWPSQAQASSGQYVMPTSSPDWVAPETSRGHAIVPGTIRSEFAGWPKADCNATYPGAVFTSFGPVLASNDGTLAPNVDGIQSDNASLPPQAHFSPFGSDCGDHYDGNTVYGTPSSDMGPAMPFQSIPIQSGSSEAPQPPSQNEAVFYDQNSGTMHQFDPALHGSTAWPRFSLDTNNTHIEPVPTVFQSMHPKFVITGDDCAHPTRSGNLYDHQRNDGQAHLSPFEFLSRQQQNAPDSLNLGPFSGARSNPWQSELRAGIPPNRRQAVDAVEIATLDDSEEQRRLEDKITEVVDWLNHSNVETGDEDAGGRRKQRPRSKSANSQAFLAHCGDHLGDLSLDGPSISDPYSNSHRWSACSNNKGADSDDESRLANRQPSNGIESCFTLPGLETELGTDIGPGIETKPGSTGSHFGAAGNDKGVDGITANLAIMRFRQRAKDMDSASMTATLGSRRASESDIGSLRGVGGLSKLLLTPTTHTKRFPAVRRKSSFLNSIIPSRSGSNKLKRKTSSPTETPEHLPQTQRLACATSEFTNGLTIPQRLGSRSRSRTPKVQTSMPTTSTGPRPPKSVTSAASGAIKGLLRSRSRSDSCKASGPGLAKLMTIHGGPPMPTLASLAQPSMSPTEKARLQAEGDSDEVFSPDSKDSAMDLSIRADMEVIPTYDGFRSQVITLNPHIETPLLEKITQEQIKRYRRLHECKVKHDCQAANGDCPAGHFCLPSGGQAKELPPRPGMSPGQPIGFQILRPNLSEAEFEDSTMESARFPPGVPLPPAARLPAEFECPLCFKVKTFHKPSDWTKHVHEDVQPFTCTFTDCDEAKSFKRKADWVRHENERHRQLEFWTCDIDECSRTCYRKDNFVQHLVREHKMPEPKVRTGGIRVKNPLAIRPESAHAWSDYMPLSTVESVDNVWVIVDRCHDASERQPEDEPCKFCGKTCSSWKKLTVHLAKHMEQIAMPVLGLVLDKAMAAPELLGQHDLHVGQGREQPFATLPMDSYKQPVATQYLEAMGFPSKSFAQNTQYLGDPSFNGSVYLTPGSISPGSFGYSSEGSSSDLHTLYAGHH